MGDIIKVRTISAATETAIQMSNGTFARLVSIGTSWSTIRLGLRLHMGYTGGDLISTPRFTFGFCAGTTNLYGDATTDHFVGIRTGAATWTSTSSIYNCATIVPTKRVGTTNTDGTSLANLITFCNGALTNVADRQILFCDLIKGSPNFTVKLFCAQNVTTDISATTFLTQMELATPALSSYIYTAGQTIAVDEATNGTLNALNVTWDRTTPVMEICDLAVAILA